MAFALRPDGPVYVYALHDPTEVSQRIYVGISTKPAQRLAGHILDAKRRRRHCCNWIRALLGRGVRPAMVILETVPPLGDWEEAERFWIASFRSMGLDLTNATDGGRGAWGHKKAAETIEKHRVQLKGVEKPPGFGARLSLAKKGQGKGRRPSPTACEQLARNARTARLRSDNTTGFRGIRQRGSRFAAHIGNRHLGTYVTAEAAARAYDDAAREAWGADAALNFPGPGERSVHR